MTTNGKPDGFLAYRAKQEHRRAYMREYMRKRRLDPEYRAKANALSRRWNAAHKGWKKERKKDESLQRHYGITLELFNDMLKLQGGVCLICGSTNRLSWDHDHETGEFRGIICNGCNMGLGNFKDNPAAMRMAARYIEWELHNAQA